MNYWTFGFHYTDSTDVRATEILDGNWTVSLGEISTHMTIFGLTEAQAKGIKQILESNSVTGAGNTCIDDETEGNGSADAGGGVVPVTLAEVG